MSKLISKELFFEVTGLRINSNHYGVNKNTIEYDENKHINIYELAHKCKEWAWNKYMTTIRSGYAEHGAWSNSPQSAASVCSMDIPLIEPHAIFQYCQWILDNKDKQ